MDYSKSLVDSIPAVISVRELPTTHFATWHLLITVREDTVVIRQEIADAIEKFRPAGVAMLGSVKIKTGYVDINFDLKSIEDADEGDMCYDTGCTGTMEVDHSNCTCGTSSGPIGPCGNCEGGLNLTCNECNMTLEEFMEEDDGMTGQEENIRHLIRTAKKGTLIFARDDIQEWIDEEGRGCEVWLYVFTESDPSEYIRHYTGIMYFQGLSEKTEYRNATKDLIKRIMRDKDRRSGRTTEQIRNLKKGALFIASHDVTGILRELDRPDVVTYVLNKDQPCRLQGLDITDVVFDHYLEGKPIRSDLSRMLYDIRRRIKEKEDKMKKEFTSPEAKSRMAIPSADLAVEETRRRIERQFMVEGKFLAQPMKLEEPKIMVSIGDDEPKELNELLKTKKEHNNMTTLNRTQVEVTLMDNDPSLKASKAIVFSTKIVSDGSKEDVIREILFDGEIAEALEKHNNMRKKIVDLGILERVGNEVMLRPVELKDLTWTVA